jgi:phospholipase/carboxylesterase
VLLHGFGAPGDDLVSLQRVMRVPRETRFVFPAGPIALDMMPGARAWWNIDMMRLQSAMERGDLRDLSTEEPEGMDEARAKIDALLGELEEKFAPRALVLGGFSQGAMLSCDVALRTERRLDGLVVLSGTLLAKDAWVPKMSRLANKPIFQSHGSNDPLLPFALAEELQHALATAGARTTWVPFRGGHEIPGPVVDRLGAFLDGVLAKPA